jgi:mannose-6-phosphate isomerase-like protein (cupin superfamily)
MPLCEIAAAGTHTFLDDTERTMMQSINFERELARLTEYWSPKVVARVNDQFVKIAKLKGELVWHKHDREDELFHVIKGSLVIQIESDQSVTLGPGDCFVVPRGTLHNPIAADECWIVLIETTTTKHTGDVMTRSSKTIEQQMA